MAWTVALAFCQLVLAMCSILGIFPEDHHTTEMFFDTDDCEAKSMESNYERVK